VNGRIIRKRIHVRIEHIQPSRCREDFLRRRETNDRIKHEAKVKGGEPTGACWGFGCWGSFVGSGVHQLLPQTLPVEVWRHSIRHLRQQEGVGATLSHHLQHNPNETP
jgi:hypothetical protein